MMGAGRYRVRRLVPGILPASIEGGLALASGVALTALSGWLVVAASLRPPILTLMTAIVGVRAFGMARPVLRYRERVRSHDAALSALAEERGRVYQRLVPLAPARLGRRGRGDLLAGVVDDLEDVTQAQVRVVVPLVSLVVAGCAAALIDALVFLPAVPVVLSSMVCAAVVGVVGWWLESRGQASVVAARASVATLSAVVVRVEAEVAAAGGQAWALRALDEAQQRLARAVSRQAWGRAVGVGLVPVVTVGHAVWMAAVVEPWLARGMSTPVAALLVLTPVALGEVIGGIPDAVGSLARARAAGRRLEGLLAMEPAVAGAEIIPEEGSEPARELPADGAPRILDAHGLTARWDSERPALAPTDLGVEPGQFVVVQGPSGSGKSTLLAVLARHLDPTGGSYLLEGRDALAEPPAVARRGLVLVDDEVHVFASTVRENLRLASPSATDRELLGALQTVGLGSWFQSLPGGLDELLGAGGRRLSGGERARFGLARAVLSERSVVLLDEPLAHLDPVTAQVVMEDLAKALSDRAVVLVSHHDEGVQHASGRVGLAAP
ncbi:thiol reductant ABC exporter subunit CydC [Luteococcus sp.]|uniref:thiol reductant ABC exporter subunit CydC n=1 Tax=Luteococcus sp. TaxID=1969402 RepID=UPI003735F9C6